MTLRDVSRQTKVAGARQEALRRLAEKYPKEFAKILSQVWAERGIEERPVGRPRASLPRRKGGSE